MSKNNDMHFEVLGVEVKMYRDHSGLVVVEWINGHWMRRGNVYRVSPERLRRVQRMQTALMEVKK